MRIKTNRAMRYSRDYDANC